jgi:hypothetical protein
MRRFEPITPDERPSRNENANDGRGDVGGFRGYITKKKAGQQRAKGAGKRRHSLMRAENFALFVA